MVGDALRCVYVYTYRSPSRINNPIGAGPTLIFANSNWCDCQLANFVLKLSICPFISSVRPLFYLLFVLLSSTLFRLLKKPRTKITVIPIKPVYITHSLQGVWSNIYRFYAQHSSKTMVWWFNSGFPGLMFVWLNEKVLTEICPRREQKTVKTPTRREG